MAAAGGYRGRDSGPLGAGAAGRAPGPGPRPSKAQAQAGLIGHTQPGGSRVRVPGGGRRRRAERGGAPWGGVGWHPPEPGPDEAGVGGPPASLLLSVRALETKKGAFLPVAAACKVAGLRLQRRLEGGTTKAPNNCGPLGWGH